MLKKCTGSIMIGIWIICFLFYSCCRPDGLESLPVTMHPQETGMWCWAASGQMVMDYLGHNVAQCVQANKRFNLTDCCSLDLCPPPITPNCNTPGGDPCACGGWPEFNKYDFSFNKTSSAPLSWEALRKQISRESYCGAKPFCFTWHWNGGGGHMMVAIGYTVIDTTRFVEINDPWPPCVGDHKFITYSAYVSGSTYSHWDDYYNVTYTGGP